MVILLALCYEVGCFNTATANQCENICLIPPMASIAICVISERSQVVLHTVDITTAILSSQFPSPLLPWDQFPAGNVPTNDTQMLSAA